MEFDGADDYLQRRNKTIVTEENINEQNKRDTIIITQVAKTYEWNNYIHVYYYVLFCR